MSDLPEIPWLELAGALAWASGAALVLAAIGWHEWLARREGQKLGRVLKRLSFRKTLAAGGVFIAAGLSASAARPLTAVLAAAAAFGLAAWLWRLVRPRQIS
jgi:hypothetical protein